MSRPPVPDPLQRIEPRKQPRQERSQEMVQRILDTAQQLAGETGIKGLTTGKIAARAGLSIGSLYQYFPNKESIILELARRWLSGFRGALERRRSGRRPRTWRAFAALMHDFFQEVANLYRESAVMLPILQLMEASAELRHVEHDHDQAIIDEMAQWFREINPALAMADAKRLGLMMLDVGHTCLSTAAESKPAQAGRIVEDLETMMLALLRPHLGLR